MGRFAAWFLDFMRGRYGFDELGRHLGFMTIVLIIVSIVAGVVASLVFDLTPLLRLGALLNLIAIFVNWASIALLIWTFYRVLSRKIDKRRAENERYLARRAKRQGKRGDKGGSAHESHGPWSAGWPGGAGWPGNAGGAGWPGGPGNAGKASSREAAGYDYLNCPFCGQRMRVPKGQGKIAVKCPSCGEKTIYNS